MLGYKSNFSYLSENGFIQLTERYNIKLENFQQGMQHNIYIIDYFIVCNIYDGNWINERFNIIKAL